MAHTNEIDLVVQYADEKAGGPDGQLVLDDVELAQSRDNRVNHGIGNEDPSHIQKGNKTYTFDATMHMNDAAARALERIDDGDARTEAVYIKDAGVFEGRADEMVFNELTVSSSDGGDTTVSMSADLFGVDYDALG